MDLATYKRIVQSQFDASLAMLEECIRACPASKWKSTIGKYAFWHVAYHTLYCTDLYTARTEAEWTVHKTYHPGGKADVEDEYPTQVMSQETLLAYCAYVRRKVRASLKSETARSLRGPAGFSWLNFTRAELPLYNMRHVQHHTGQLSAFLRRAKVRTRWAKGGRRV